MKILASGILSTAALGLALSCGGGGGGGSSYTPTPTIPPGTIYVGAMGEYGSTSNVFNTASGTSTLTIKAGDTVTWKWIVSGHTVDSSASSGSCTADGVYSSGGVQSVGYTMTHKFTTAGTYYYFCATHCSTGMTGTIVVNP